MKRIEEFTLVEYVYRLFSEKKDKGGQPYIDHLLRVADKVNKLYPTETHLYRAALLHDVLEDIKDFNPDDLLTFVEPPVIELVKILTRNPEIESYQDYIIRISKNTDAIKIKLADLEDNMDLTRLTKYLKDSDLKRIEKYHNCYIFLTKILKYNESKTLSN
jgi:(p)ppGpp synthase/HD superfamily hydrolase